MTNNQKNKSWSNTSENEYNNAGYKPTTYTNTYRHTPFFLSLSIHLPSSNETKKTLSILLTILIVLANQRKNMFLKWWTSLSPLSLFPLLSFSKLDHPSYLIFVLIKKFRKTATLNDDNNTAPTPSTISGGNSVLWLFFFARPHSQQRKRHFTYIFTQLEFGQKEYWFNIYYFFSDRQSER